MTFLVAGFLLGLGGSAHCVGMCGPLVLYSSRSGNAVIYQASRITMYVALAVVAALAGRALIFTTSRNWLACAIGAALVAQAASLAGAAARDSVRGRTRPPSVWTTRVTAALAAAARHLPTNGRWRSLALGALNGLLPCGLVYVALATAVGLGDVRLAMLFVAGFGIGSVPAFAMLLHSARALGPRVPVWMRRASPAAVAMVGLLLIVRGLTVTHTHAAPVDGRYVHVHTP